MRYLLDTNIIIHHLDEFQNCRYFKNSFISEITILEILKNLNAHNYKRRKATIDAIERSTIKIRWGNPEYQLYNLYNEKKDILSEDLKHIYGRVAKSNNFKDIEDCIEVFKEYHRYCEQLDRTLFAVTTTSFLSILPKCSKKVQIDLDNKIITKPGIAEVASILCDNLHSVNNGSISYLFGQFDPSKYSKHKHKDFFKTLALYLLYKNCILDPSNMTDEGFKLFQFFQKNHLDHDKRFLDKDSIVARNDASDFTQVLYLTKGCFFVTDDKKITPYFNASGIKTLTFNEFKELGS